MKKILKPLFVLGASALLLTACGGVNLGEKISKEDFVAKSAQVKKMPKSAHIKIQGSASYEATGSEKETEDLAFDKDVDIATIDTLPEKEQMLLQNTLIQWNVETYLRGYDRGFSEYSTYYFDKGTSSLGVTADGSKTEGQTSGSIHVVIKWEEHGFPVNVDFRMSTKMGDRSGTETYNFSVTYSNVVEAD